MTEVRDSRKHRNDRSGRASGGQASPAGRGERIAKALARAGVASRREVERYIAEGRVALNGQVLDSPAVLVGPGDILTVDGKPIDKPEATRVFRYHKPAGLLTSHTDPKGRPTVFEALPTGLPRVISVGRLDLNSEGLLLLTNDGALSRALELPTSGWIRRYRARARGRVTQERLDTLKNGVTVEGVAYGPIEAKLDKAKEAAPGTNAPANLWITVALTEGKNREVRRVLEHLGLKVNRLIRLAYGPFQLGTLAPGTVEEVGPRVIRELLEGVIPPESMPTGERPQFTPPRVETGEARRRPASPAAAAPRGYGRKGIESKVIGPRAAEPKGFGSRSGARAGGPKPSGPKAPDARAAGPRNAAKPGPARSVEAAAAPEKKTYKAGWAKPKKRPVRSPRPAKGAGRPPKPPPED
jgi:23S rRNA pseudouridine2605 synthase